MQRIKTLSLNPVMGICTKLVVIYGPPGVGKLTVGRQLSKLTGFNVFHNHLTVDLVESILDMEHRDFWKLVGRYRLELIGIAAMENVKGLILTTVFVKEDERYFRKLVNIVKKHGGSLHFVRLYCDVDELRRRLKKPSRRAYKKIRSVEVLDDFISKHGAFDAISFVRSFSIDNTKVPAKRTAELIKKHYRL